MSPDRQIALILKFGRIKCGYYINHGIAPYMLQLLYKEIEFSPYYAVSFDESLNKSLQRGQMDILVIYWNADTNIAETRYLKSNFLGGANAEQILKRFEDCIARLKPQEILLIASDGPNINLKSLKQFSEKLVFSGLPQLVNIGTGVKKTGSNVGKVMKATWQILDECPAKRDVYESITESNLYPLPCCGHRWCENDNCANRAEFGWPGIIKFVKYL